MRLFFFIVLSMFFHTNQAFAYITSDPGSYVRQARSLDQLKTQFKQLQVLEKEIMGIQKTLTGSHGYGSSIQPEINRLRGKLNGYTQSLLQLDLPSGGKINPRKVADVSEYLDSVFKADRSDGKYGLNAPLQRNYRQKTLKASLEKSEVAIASARDTYDQAIIASNEIDSTIGLKAAQDLTNKLIVQLIIVQGKALEMLAHMLRSEAAQKYTGVKSGGDVKRVKKPRWEVLRERSLALRNNPPKHKPKVCTAFMKRLGGCN